MTGRLSAGNQEIIPGCNFIEKWRRHMPDDMVILTRTFDLLNWLLPKSEKFPKLYRNTITQRLMESALDFQEALFDAQSLRGDERLKCLLIADAQLNKLRLYLRLAHHWQWLNNGQYNHVSQMVAELGRLLGGWLKQARKAE
jgi:hypothetical protein